MSLNGSISDSICKVILMLINIKHWFAFSLSLLIVCDQYTSQFLRHLWCGDIVCGITWYFVNVYLTVKITNSPTLQAWEQQIFYKEIVLLLCKYKSFIFPNSTLNTTKQNPLKSGWQSCTVRDRDYPLIVLENSQ